jgi:hypothetical protein
MKKNASFLAPISVLCCNKLFYQKIKKKVNNITENIYQKRVGDDKKIIYGTGENII